MAEIKDFRKLFDRIPVLGETGFGSIAAAHDSQKLKNKNSYLRLRGRHSGFDDWRAPVLAADRQARKPVGDRF